MPSVSKNLKEISEDYTLNYTATHVEEEGCGPTSCPAKRKINMFPKRRGKTTFKNAERS